MITILLTLALFTAQPSTTTQSDIQPTPDTAPITLTIDGVPHQLHDGHTTTITIDGKTYEVRIDLPTIARFPGDLIAFDYPTRGVSASIREASDGFIMTQIKLGNSVLQVFEFDAPVPLENLFQSLVRDFEEAQAAFTTSDTQLQTQAGNLEGRALEVDSAGTIVRTEVYRVANDTHTTFILFQDPRPTPTPSPQYLTLRDTFAQTLQLR